MERSYKIADVILNIDANELEERRYRVYEIDYTDKPQIIADGDWTIIKKESPNFPDQFCKYSANSREFYNKLLQFDGCIIHSSAIIIDGTAFLFTADSGTGKSTHTTLYRRVFGDERVRILNDDKPALRLEDGQWYAYGTPWSGKHDISTNLRAPVAGICFLRRAQENTIAPYTGAQAVFALLEQTARPPAAQLRQQLMILADKLLTQVPVWQMGCNMDPQAAQVSYAAMSQGRKDMKNEN